MQKKDSHYTIFNETKTTPLADFTGGLNLADPPVLLKSNQLLEATNWQYSDIGDGVETRSPIFTNAMARMESVTDPDIDVIWDPPSESVEGGLLLPVDGVLFYVSGGVLYSFPSLLRIFSTGMYRCSDFTWMRLGVWNCRNAGDTYNKTCDVYINTPEYVNLPIEYSPEVYQVDRVGDLTGSVDPISTVWGDSKPDLLVASGGKLQLSKYGGIIDTMEDSPDCTYVTKRDGRALVNDLEHPSRLVLSGIGDPSNWKQSGTSGWTEADSIWIDIGYKSGGEISSIATLSKDLIIWKTNGTVYRLTGSYPDWGVYEIGRNVWNANPYCPVEAGGDLFFPDTFFGFSSIQTVIQYGEMRAGTVGYEVNKVIIQEMDTDARMWSVPSRGELWIKPRAGVNYVYVYKLRHRAWTKFVFLSEVLGVACVGNWTYLTFAGLGYRTVTFIMGEDGKKFLESIPDSFKIRLDRLAYMDDLISYETEIASSSITGQLKFPPLYANTGRNLLKHLVVDLWGPPVVEEGEGEPGEGDEPGGGDDYICEGPWKWIKLTMLAGSEDGNEYLASFWSMMVFGDVVRMNPMNPGDDICLDGFPPVLSLPTLGTAHASSFYNQGGYTNPPIGVFYAGSMGQSYWRSVPSETRNEEWVAFEFDTPQLLADIYIGFYGYLPSEAPVIPMQGGDVMVSNDSTDGVDGTWYTLYTGAFDELNQEGLYTIGYLEIPLCTGEGMIIHPAPRVCEYQDTGYIGHHGLEAKTLYFYSLTYPDYIGNYFYYDEETTFYIDGNPVSPETLLVGFPIGAELTYDDNHFLCTVVYTPF